jgi:hypothetical protein
LFARRIGPLLVHLALRLGGRLAWLLHPLHWHLALRHRCADLGRRTGRLGTADRLGGHHGWSFALEVALRPGHFARHFRRVVAPAFPWLEFARGSRRRFAAQTTFFRLVALTGVALGIARFGAHRFRPLHRRVRAGHSGRFRLRLRRPAEDITA